MLSLISVCDCMMMMMMVVVGGTLLCVPGPQTCLSFFLHEGVGFENWCFFFLDDGWVAGWPGGDVDWLMVDILMVVQKK